ncbi:hypothetical protein MBLNU13_g04883t1 [Cladosporium sp. NU13]
MGNRTLRKGTPLSMHSSKKQVNRTEGSLAPPADDSNPPNYSEEDAAPSYSTTEDDFLEFVKKKEFDLTFRTKPFSQEKLLPLEGEKKVAALDLTLRIKPSPVTKETPLLAQDGKKFAALDLAIRPKPSPKPTQQEVWITALKLSPSQAAPFPLPPGVCTKDPVCTCGGKFEYQTDMSDAYGEAFGLNPTTKSRRECMEKLRLLSRFQSTEWRAWSNAHEEVSEDES